MSGSKQNQSLTNWVLELIPSSSSAENGKTSSTMGTAIINALTKKRYTYTFPSSLVNSIPHPPFITQRTYDAQLAKLSQSFRSSDVFICTFSKCGTTLAEQIVLLLLNGGKVEELNPLHKNTLDSNSCKSKVVGKIWTEMAVVNGLFEDDDMSNENENGVKQACMGEGKAKMSPEQFNTLPSPRVLKTHTPTQLFLDQEQKVAKVIYITRNPFDACVSCYYHPKPGVSPASQGMPFDAFCKLWLSTSAEFGGWIDHTKGWRYTYLNSHNNNNKSDNAEMLWISYEELVSKPIEAIAKIAIFIEVDTSLDPTLIQRVATGSKFDNVKKAA